MLFGGGFIYHELKGVCFYLYISLTGCDGALWVVCVMMPGICARFEAWWDFLNFCEEEEYTFAGFESRQYDILRKYQVVPLPLSNFPDFDPTKRSYIPLSISSLKARQHVGFSVPLF